MFWAQLQIVSEDIERPQFPEFPEFSEMPGTPEMPTAQSLKTRYFGFSGVHSPTGNYSAPFTDMTVPTVLGDLTFTRTYNSLNYEVSNVGKGFSFSYDMKVITENGNKCVILPNGSRWNFAESNGVFTALDSRGVLKRENGNYILETLEKMRYVLNSAGYIMYVEDFTGNRITITTGIDGRIESLSDSSGALVTFEYSGDKLTSVTDKKSDRNAVYHYNGNLLDYAIDSAGMRTDYSYTSDGFLLGVTDHIGRSVLSISYMPNSENYGYGGKVHTVTDVTGNTRTYTYDEDNMRTIITDSNGRSTTEGYGYDLAVSSSTNELGLTTRVNYLMIDGQNKFNEVESSTDMYGNTTKYDRDNKGHITKITYPDNSTEKFTFDSLGNMISKTDRNGAITWYIYEGYYLVKEIRPLDGVSAYSTSANQDNYAITEFTYDAVKKGSVNTVCSPTGDANNYIRYTYNAMGEISAETRYVNGIGYTTHYFYDNVHRITKQISPDGTQTEYEYNFAGQITKSTVTSPDGNIVLVNRMEYDELGRKIKDISPIGAETKYYYNYAGFVDYQTDAIGNTTCFEYDFYGNITKQILANGSYVYDAGNPRR